eukprot:m.49180 g.49180  ORF g.49180 m.49180 type:complete len:486 (-) comp11079_c1_seq2:430-1887(-)
MAWWQQSIRAFVRGRSAITQSPWVASQLARQQLRANWQARSIHTTSAIYSKDYYEILGVERSADEKAIKRAYFSLAKKFHPDKNPGDKEASDKFAEISEAYEVLSDADRRRSYDQFGSADGQQFGGGGGFGGFSSDHAADVFADFLRNSGFDMGNSGFGFNRPQQRAVSVRLTFEEAVHGVEKTINVPTTRACTACSGTGSATKKVVTCPTCNGAGVETARMGMMAYQSTCRRCAGTGSLAEKICQPCGGNGSVRTQEELTVQIPAGVDDGTTLSIDNSHILQIQVIPSRIFRRRDNHVYSTVKLSLSQAILGGSKVIPGLYGDMSIAIPAGSASGQKLRLRDRGIVSLSTHQRGAHFVELDVDMSLNLTKKQRELIEQFALTQKQDGEVNGVSKGTPRKVLIDELELEQLRQQAASATSSSSTGASVAATAAATAAASAGTSADDVDQLSSAPRVEQETLEKDEDEDGNDEADEGEAKSQCTVS